MKRLTSLLLLAAALTAHLAGQSLPVESGTTLLLRFDGTLNGVQGEVPASVGTSGVSFVPGLLGQAVLLTAGHQLSFAASNNISATAGTLEFWIKPNWPGNSLSPKTMLSWGSSGGLIFGKDGAPNWRSLFNRFLLEQSAATPAANLSAGQWRHSAFTWDATTLRLYLDGIQVAQTALTAPLPTISATNFFLGRDNSADDIDAAIDELRISNRARTATEIAIAYNLLRPEVPGTLSTVTGTGTAAFSGDGAPATSAAISAPNAIAVDNAGNFYLSDALNRRIRRVSVDGLIASFAGNGSATSSGDSGPAPSASFNPTAIALDPAGNLFIADFNSRIRKVDALTRLISTVVGNGQPGFSGDGGSATAATISQPAGLAFDTAGNLYFSDQGARRVRRVNPAGIISTVAGNGLPGFSGDGDSATAATIAPAHIALRPDGTLLIAEPTNHRIRSVAPSGIITTIAGTGTCGFSGDGGPATSATLCAPTSVAVDSLDNLYLSDSSNHRIRKISLAGTISTLAGTGLPGYAGDSGLPASAQLNAPNHIALDNQSNVYISDSGNNRIRRINLSTARLLSVSPLSALAGSATFDLGFLLFGNHRLLRPRLGLDPKENRPQIAVLPMRIRSPRLRQNPTQILVPLLGPPTVLHPPHSRGSPDSTPPNSRNAPRPETRSCPLPTPQSTATPLSSPPLESSATAPICSAYGATAFSIAASKSVSDLLRKSYCSTLVSKLAQAIGGEALIG